ncbi:helix-turn-helix transcriptional regulator [Ligilactobacillus animalis]|uniref:Helix-turn-helix transcriptional regulator n=2 Tax=Ligilactobacillus animalis TaxID=1605 RepID=A0AAJ6FPD6_9LACO|nr:helix-turn-helix transcriptional regulator [Ligilactobacillus animalis]WHQ80773.1 helix-turn-helix transcriptional regulator [Ligilactobacillus animalis]
MLLYNFKILITIKRDKEVSKIVNIGNNVRYFRKKYHFTQEQLAEKSGLSVNFISRLERTSDQNVSIKTLIKIAEAFDISLSDLVAVANTTSELESNRNIVELTNKLGKLDDEKADKFSQAFIQLLELSAND